MTLMQLRNGRGQKINPATFFFFPKEQWMIQAVSCTHTNIWSRRHHTECLDTDFHCRRAHAIITQSLNLINGFKFEFPHSEESEKGKVVATSPNDNLALAPARMDMHARGDLYKVSLSLPVPCILNACQFALIALSLSLSEASIALLFPVYFCRFQPQ